MKNVHLLHKEGDKFGFSHFILVKNGFVYTSDGDVIARVPAEKVFGHIFGIPNIRPDEELYFKKSFFEAGKIYSADFIRRDGNKFEAFKNTPKGEKKIGDITATRPPGSIVFPDFEALYSKLGPVILSHSISSVLLDRIADVIGHHMVEVSRYSFESDTYTVVREADNPDNEVLALIGGNSGLRPYWYDLHEPLPAQLLEAVNAQLKNHSPERIIQQLQMLNFL